MQDLDKLSTMHIRRERGCHLLHPLNSLFSLLLKIYTQFPTCSLTLHARRPKTEWGRGLWGLVPIARTNLKFHNSNPPPFIIFAN